MPNYNDANINYNDCTVAYGAEVSEVKPDGSGDFTTLQSWEDYADGQTLASQWAEIYKGGDLGNLLIGFWTAIPTANDYPKVYAPLSERHGGTISTPGAFINADTANGIDVFRVNYVRIEGVTVYVQGNYTGIYLVGDSGGIDYCLVDSNMVVNDKAAAGGTGIVVYSFDNDPTGVVVRNNIIYGKGILSNGIAVNAELVSIVNVTLDNNTVCSCATRGQTVSEDSLKMGDSEVYLTSRNNVITGCGVDDYIWPVQGGVTESKNNLSSDDTADDGGGTGHLIDEDPAYLFVNNNTDARLRTGSNALNAGTTLSDFDWDAVHNCADGWRPQGAAWDMGALEAEGGGGVSPRQSRNPSAYGIPVIY